MRHESSVLRTVFAVAACSLLCTGCGSSSPTTPNAPGGNPTPPATSVRIGWTQSASSLSEASSYAYKVYVDRTNRLDLIGPTCSAGSAGGFDCVATLPEIAQGQHQLELVAVNADGESPRSQPLTITVTATGISLVPPA